LRGDYPPSNKQLNRYILNIKNGIKHIDGVHDLEIKFDIKREVNNMIHRAIDNFNNIPQLKKSTELLAYYQHEKDSTIRL
jgi:hypothetical protein